MLLPRPRRSVVRAASTQACAGGTGMERVPVTGGELEVEVRGTGDPVVLIHGALIRDAFAPLLAQEALTTRYRVISYHLRGYGGSTRPPTSFRVADQAADAAAVLRQLGVEQ